MKATRRAGRGVCVAFVASMRSGFVVCGVDVKTGNKLSRHRDQAAQVCPLRFTGLALGCLQVVKSSARFL
jgi:hypothetical protein